MLIAQITDTHIKPEGSLAYGHVDTSAFLARAVDHILHLDPRPDVVLGTGDLVDGGTPAEYARLRLGAWNRIAHALRRHVLIARDRVPVADITYSSRYNQDKQIENR